MAKVFLAGYGRTRAGRGGKLVGLIARHESVQRSLADTTREAAAEAQDILDNAPTGVGNSYIEASKGKVDHYVTLVDPGPHDPKHTFGREGMAAMSIEMGRGADPDGRWGQVDPVAPLQTATGFMVSNFPRSPRRNRKYPSVQSRRNQRGGGKKRG